MAGCDLRAQLRRRVARRPLDRDARRVHPDRRLRRVRAVRGGAAAQRPALHPGLDRRGLRRGARGPRHRGLAARCRAAPTPPARPAATGSPTPTATTYGLPVVVTRCSNNYGPRQYPEKLVPLFVTNAIDDQPLPVYGTGLNRRDWLHVDDHCDALLALLEHPGVEGETFNIGAEHELDVLDHHRHHPRPARQARDADPPRRGPARPRPPLRGGLVQARPASPAGARRSPFEDGIRDTVEWFRANESWWRPIKEGEFRAVLRAHVRPAQGPEGGASVTRDAGSASVLLALALLALVAPPPALAADSRRTPTTIPGRHRPPERSAESRKASRLDAPPHLPDRAPGRARSTPRPTCSAPATCSSSTCGAARAHRCRSRSSPEGTVFLPGPRLDRRRRPDPGLGARARAEDDRRAVRRRARRRAAAAALRSFKVYVTGVVKTAGRGRGHLGDARERGGGARRAGRRTRRGATSRSRHATAR